MNKIKQEQSKNILSPQNHSNIIPQRKNKRDLLQGYYTSINLDALCEGDIDCDTRPLSFIEEIINKSFAMSEIYLANQLDQAAIKSKLGKTKICDYDSVMNVHYWTMHLSIFLQDVLAYSNSTKDKCVSDAALDKFKKKYEIDCIIENMNCKKDQLALLFNQIYKVFLSVIPKCDYTISANWDDDFYCLCSSDPLPEITINEIIPTYRTLAVDWNHNATGILYLIEAFDQDTDELVVSLMTSDKNVIIEGLQPDQAYNVRVSASNCASSVSTNKVQNTLPVFITVNLIDNRVIKNSSEYNISFIGTRKLEEDEMFILDFRFINALQQQLDVLTPNKYSYFSKIDVYDAVNFNRIFVNNQSNASLTKLDYYLGLLTQARYRIQPLINTTIDIYLDEITYEMSNGVCDVLDLNYNSLSVRNSEENRIGDLTNLVMSLLQQINSNTLFIGQEAVSETTANITKIGAAVCCTDPTIEEINLFVTDNLGDSFTINYTPTPSSVITVSVVDTLTSSTIFTGDISPNISSLIIDSTYGVVGSSEYSITVTVTNCTGTLTETLEILTSITYTLTVNAINDIGNLRVTTPRGGTTQITNLGSTEFILRPNEVAKLDVGSVNLNTGAFEASNIEINYPNYKMPLRFVTKVNNVITNGGVLNNILDENSVVKARTYNINMTNNNFVDVTFTPIRTLFDYDFTSPQTLNGAGIGDKVTTITDNTNRIPTIVNSLVSSGERTAKGLKISGSQTYAISFPAISTPKSSYFFVGEAVDFKYGKPFDQENYQIKYLRLRNIVPISLFQDRGLSYNRNVGNIINPGWGLEDIVANPSMNMLNNNIAPAINTPYLISHSNASTILSQKYSNGVTTQATLKSRWSGITVDAFNINWTFQLANPMFDFTFTRLFALIDAITADEFNIINAKLIAYHNI